MFLRTYPRYLWLGIIFFCTGHRPPNYQSKDTHGLLPFSEVEFAECNSPPPLPLDQINYPTANIHVHEMPSVQLEPTLGTHPQSTGV